MGVVESDLQFDEDEHDIIKNRRRFQERFEFKENLESRESEQFRRYFEAQKYRLPIRNK